MPDRDDIISIEIRCFEVRGDGDGLVRYSAIIITTVRGAPAMIKSYMADLVVARRAHHAREGSYATRAEALGFFDSRASFELAIHVVEGGWSATGSLAGVALSCSVADGTAAATARLSPGEPTCRRTEGR